MKFLISTHGDLAGGIKQSAEMLIGKVENVDVISLKPNIGIEEFREMVEEYFEKQKDEQVFVFIDILGGTPFNIINEITYENKNVKNMYGVNLPIFIECYSAMSYSTLEEIEEIIKNSIDESIGVTEI